ncbi:MAG: nucleotide-binding protein [Euryarchaeota archaeon]|nr:nucleotide-binding protein [Euryarchaeota archaeon]
MDSDKINKLVEYANTPDDFNGPVFIERWQRHVEAFLRVAIGQDVLVSFMNHDCLNKWDAFAAQTGYLNALVCEFHQTSESKYENVQGISDKTIDPIHSKKVFVVHGRDNEEKEKVSRFIENAGLKAIILHEQPNEGLTVVEKFELHSDVIFAVILLTPDDMAYNTNAPENVCSRSRQNVVLELGYFLGKLGRSRVCVLHKGDIELPSDIQGVLYVELDPHGAWRNKLAKEFINANLTIDLSVLV